MSKPTLLEIKSIFGFWKGAKMCGGLVSTADFSIEVGNQWKDPKTDEIRAKFTLFISCHWVMRHKGNIVVTDEMQHVEEWAMRAQEFLNEKIIRRVSFDTSNHSLSIETESDESLFVCPTVNEEGPSEWTLFHLAFPEHRVWCTFDGTSIKYND